MESMRDVLKRSLGRSLEALPMMDRMAAAWSVACGKAMAARGEVVGFDGNLLRVEVRDAMWLEQMLSMRGMLAAEVGRIAGVKVGGIHFEVRKPEPRRTGEGHGDERRGGNSRGGSAGGGTGKPGADRGGRAEDAT